MRLKSVIFINCFRCMIGILIMCCAVPKMALSQEVGYKAQSLFIYQFTKYISWPEDYVQGDLVIGVYGNCPIMEELRIMASLKKAPNGNPIIIKQINSLQEIRSLHILFVPASKSREMTSINLQLDDSPTLTVAERDGMAKKGAMISFIVLENGVLKFEINKTALERKKLIIAPDLLKLGFIVG